MVARIRPGHDVKRLPWALVDVRRANSAWCSMTLFDARSFSESRRTGGSELVY